MASYNSNKSEKRKMENKKISSGEIEVVQKKFKSDQNDFEVIPKEIKVHIFLIEDERQLQLEFQRTNQNYQWKYDNILKIRKIIYENEFLEDQLKADWINFINGNVGKFLLNIQLLICRISEFTSYKYNAATFMSLAIENNWLEDNILDLMIGLKCRDSPSVQYIETCAADLIKFGDRSILPRFEEDKDCAMAVFNYHGNHWVFFFLQKTTRRLFVVDPTGNADVERKVAEKILRCFAGVKNKTASQDLTSLTSETPR